MPTIDVNLPGRPYQIMIEPGSMSRLGGIVRRVVGEVETAARGRPGRY